VRISHHSSTATEIPRTSLVDNVLGLQKSFMVFCQFGKHKGLAVPALSGDGGSSQQTLQYPNPHDLTPTTCLRIPRTLSLVSPAAKTKKPRGGAEVFRPGSVCEKVQWLTYYPAHHQNKETRGRIDVTVNGLFAGLGAIGWCLCCIYTRLGVVVAAEQVD
jgi:hypothetical protein